jgi:hypothetical protein
MMTLRTLVLIVILLPDTGGLETGGLNNPLVSTTAVIWPTVLKSTVGHLTHQHWLRKAHLYKRRGFEKPDVALESVSTRMC